MAGEIYRRPVMFAIVAAAVILTGTAVTMFIPMMTSQMHPRLEGLKPFTAIELAGRDIYQREGCNNCHTQTIRPLKTEVMRYGEYSKAGEFAYDRPFLWGSKRTGPDLARIGRKYPDAWHYRHFEDPRKFFLKSNMPAYGWLKENSLDPRDIRRHMDTLCISYTEEEIASLKDQNELDALVAYVQVLGTAIPRKSVARLRREAVAVEMVNPLAGDPLAIAAGRELFGENCAVCHGDNGEGDIGPSLVDNVFLHKKGDLADNLYYELISSGTEEEMKLGGRAMEGGMPSFMEEMSRDEIWSVIVFIRLLQGK